RAGSGPKRSRRGWNEAGPGARSGAAVASARSAGRLLRLDSWRQDAGRVQVLDTRREVPNVGPLCLAFAGHAVDRLQVVSLAVDLDHEILLLVRNLRNGHGIDDDAGRHLL